MSKIKEVITEFAINQRSEKGRITNYKKGKGLLTIETELASSTKGDGDLKIYKRNGDLLAWYQQATGMRKTCEYKISGTESELEQLISSLQSQPSVRTQTDDNLLSYFEKERTLVHAEVENIKDCRTSVFVRTLAILGAAGIAILGLINMSEESPPLLTWLPFAAAIPILLLTTAIATITHKARCINERIGYLEAIEELKCNHRLDLMKSWILSYATNRKCKIYDGNNSNNSKTCPINKGQLHCIVDGRQTAYAEINKHVKLLPHLLNSFTSLCTYVYAFAYIISVTSFLWSIIYSIKLYFTAHYPEDNVNSVVFWAAVSIGTTATSLISAKTFKSKLTTSDKTNWEYFLQWLGNLSPVIIALLMLGLVVSLNFGTSATWIALFAYIIGGFASAIAVNIAYSSLEKVNSLRRGRQSVDCWKHVWLIRFAKCPLLNSWPSN